MRRAYLLPVKMLSLQVKCTVAEPREAAQPIILKSSHTEMSPKICALSNVMESNKLFFKLQSPTTSEFDSDSESDGTNSEDGRIGFVVNPVSIKEKLETELLPQNTALFYEDKNEQYAALQQSIMHSEVGHPSTSQGEMVIGYDLSLSSFYVKNRHTLKRLKTHCQHAIPTEIPSEDIWRLLSQQNVIVKGWKEHISSPTKQSLKTLVCTQDLINGHPIGKCILNVFRRNSHFYRGDFIGERRGPKLVNSSQNTTPHRKLFSQETDASISLWEKAFSEQFGKEQIMFKGCNVTAPLLLVLLYRCAYKGSIMIRHFILSECKNCMRCSLGIQRVMLNLDRIHCLMCLRAQHMSSAICADWSLIKDLEQLHLLYHHSEASARDFPYIEFPHLIEIGIQRRKKKLTKTLHIIYMQIPPYFFAVPADCSSEITFHELEPHFPSVIREIHKELEIEREEFLKQRPELCNEESLVMIYPYRYDPDGQPSECRFLRVDVKIDG